MSVSKINKALDKSGVQGFWGKIKMFFISKEDAKNYLTKSEWKKTQYKIGTIDLSTPGQKTITCGFRPTTFSMRQRGGLTVYAYQDGVSFITTAISDFKVNDTEVTFRLNTNLDSNVIWEAYGEDLS